MSVADWEVLEPDTDVEATRRISLEPVFSGDRVVLIELLYAHSADDELLRDLESSLDDSGENLKATVSWKLDGKPVSLDWNLRGRKVQLK